MFFPRLITFLVALGCGTLALLAASEYLFAIPLSFLKWVVVSTTSFFSTSALVMLIGLTDAKRTETGELKFGTTLRGRMMRKITTRSGWWREKHCCDVYLDTSLASLLTMVAMGVAALLVYLALEKTTAFIAVMLIVPVIFGLVWGLGKLTERMQKSERIMSVHLSPTADLVMRRVGIVCLSILFGLTICAMLFVFIYSPVAELMRMGYTLLSAIALYVGILLLLPIPLYCIGGKKLLLGTKLGEKICPVVRR